MYQSAARLWCICCEHFSVSENRLFMELYRCLDHFLVFSASVISWNRNQFSLDHWIESRLTHTFKRKGLRPGKLSKEWHLRPLRAEWHFASARAHVQKSLSCERHSWFPTWYVHGRSSEFISRISGQSGKSNQFVGHITTQKRHP